MILHERQDFNIYILTLKSRIGKPHMVRNIYILKKKKSVKKTRRINTIYCEDA